MRVESIDLESSFVTISPEDEEGFVFTVGVYPRERPDIMSMGRALRFDIVRKDLAGIDESDANLLAACLDFPSPPFANYKLRRVGNLLVSQNYEIQLEEGVMIAEATLVMPSTLRPVEAAA